MKNVRIYFSIFCCFFGVLFLFLQTFQNVYNHKGYCVLYLTCLFSDYVMIAVQFFAWGIGYVVESQGSSISSPNIKHYESFNNEQTNNSKSQNQNQSLLKKQTRSPKSRPIVKFFAQVLLSRK